MYVICVLNIGLIHFPLLLDPCSLPFYTTNPIYHQLSHRECFLYTCFIAFYS